MRQNVAILQMTVDPIKDNQTYGTEATTCSKADWNSLLILASSNSNRLQLSFLLDEWSLQYHRSGILSSGQRSFGRKPPFDALQYI